MSANYIYIVCCVLVSIKHALSLECYTTDLTAIKHGDYRTQLENCEKYITKILQIRGHRNTNLPHGINFRCFTVEVDRDYFDVAVKGCVPTNGCGVMKSVVKSVLQKDSSHGLIQNVECHECAGDGCNRYTDLKFERFIKSSVIEA